MREPIKRWGVFRGDMRELTGMSMVLVVFAVLCAAGCAGSGLGLWSLISSGALLLSLVLAACADSHGGHGGSAGTSAGSGGTAGAAGVGGVGGVAGSAGSGGVGGVAGIAGSSGVGGTGGVAGTAGVGGTAGEYCTTYTECTDGVPHEEMGCCPAGAACNFWSAEICADGSCVQLGEVCPENCHGTLEQTCENGMLVDVCCPVGVECNYGQGLTICDDGSCVNAPDICLPEGCFQGLDCIDGVPTAVPICGCDITICNYFPATLCDDGSCVPPGQLCAL